MIGMIVKRWLGKLHSFALFAVETVVSHRSVDTAAGVLFIVREAWFEEASGEATRLTRCLRCACSGCG